MRWYRSLGIATALVALSACGQEIGGSGEDYEAATEDIGAPSSPPSSAPGVSFRFGYDFRLEDEQIDDIQEKHAERCESFGLARCRITGMRYSVNRSDQVVGMLRVSLDPTIARDFGKAAVEDVESGGGRMVNATFDGEDESPVIRQASTRRSEVQAEIAEIERRLDGMAPGDRERTQLQQQLSQLRNELSAASSTISGSEQRLASTPMTFNYYGEGGVPGFEGVNPVKEAWHGFLESSVTLIRFLLSTVAVLLPWAVLLLILVWIARSRAGLWIRDTFSVRTRRPEDEGA